MLLWQHIVFLDCDKSLTIWSFTMSFSKSFHQCFPQWPQVKNKLKIKEYKFQASGHVYVCICSCVFVFICKGAYLRVYLPTCGRSYNIPGGGLRHCIRQSLPEAFICTVCWANVVPWYTKAFGPATAYFQQSDAAPVKLTCIQNRKHRVNGLGDAYN